MFSFTRIPHTYETNTNRKKHETPETKEVSARREHSRTHPKLQTELVDGSLIIIYRFYCKIQQPGSKLGGNRPDFDDIKECNGSMSFLGVVSFLRDFDFVPRYVLSDVRI